MGILDRFTDIIKANINDLLDRAEDPAKMIDQYMRELTDNLAEVKQETAAVMAEEARAKRAVDANQAEIDKYDDLARRALKAGNEGDARTFLAKKQSLVAKADALRVTYEAAQGNALKMRELHDKLVTDIETLNGRRGQGRPDARPGQRRGRAGYACRRPRGRPRGQVRRLGRHPGRGRRDRPPQEGDGALDPSGADLHLAL